MIHAEDGAHGLKKRGNLMPGYGKMVMEMTDMLRGPVRRWLATCRTEDGRPIASEQAHGIAFELAQDIIKQRQNKPH